MRVFIIGGTGLVGSNVVTRCNEGSHDVCASSRTAGDADVALDKTDRDETISTIEEFDPELVVDTAAFHDVDACESERANAWQVNAAGTRNVARAADKADAHFVYLSTDYVFSGNPSEAPYLETDPVNPINYYARSKYAGEIAAEAAETYTVLRSSVIYGLANDNFATWVLSELAAGNEIGIVDDQISTTTYAPDLAKSCLTVAKKELTGVYHATGPVSQSRYEFTCLLAEKYGYDTELVVPTATEDVDQIAPRPTDGSLDSLRLYEAIDYRFRPPEKALREMRKADD